MRLSVASTVFGMENSLLAYSVIAPSAFTFSFVTCRKYFSRSERDSLVHVLLEYEQVAAHLDTARLHEKRVGKPYRTDKVGMADKVFSHEFVAPACRLRPLK